MTPVTIFTTILFLISAHFIFSRLLAWLNLRKQQVPLPDEVKEMYDEDKYKNSVQYQLEKSRLGFIAESLMFALLILLLLFQGFAILDEWCTSYTNSEILRTLLFFGILWLAWEILSIPIEVYSIFHIEQKFGFNTMNIKLYLSDKLKTWLLTILIGGLLLSLTVLFYEATGKWFWLLVLALLSAFSLFMVLFYIQLIVPLFNKLSPLEDGVLKTAIQKLADKTKFPLHGIYIINNSKRSKKSNAYFTGLGNKKRIVLFDTLIANHQVDELVSILAHEIGHYRKKHIQTGMFIGIFQTGFLLFLLSIFLSHIEFQEALGVYVPSFHIGILVFGLIYSPFSMIIDYLGNTISRKNEYEADKFAAENSSASALKKALIRLSSDNLSNLFPHPLYVNIYYSHPTLIQRLRRIDSYKTIKQSTDET